MDGSDLLEELMSNMKSSELSPDDPLSYTSDCPNSCFKMKRKNVKVKNRKKKKLTINENRVTNLKKPLLYQ